MITTPRSNATGGDLLTSGPRRRRRAAPGGAVFFLSLHTAEPGLKGVSEVTGNAYYRAVVLFRASAPGRSFSNHFPSTFPAPSPAAWGTVTHFGLWDAATEGNLLFYDVFGDPLATSVGVAIQFPPGNVTIWDPGFWP